MMSERRALLIHGFGGTPCELAELRDSLVQRGWVVLAPALPGHGRTSRNLGQVSWMQWARFVIEQTESSNKKVGQWSVVGLSLGGLLALYLAARRPDVISSVVTVSTPWRIVSRFLRPIVMLGSKMRLRVKPRGKDVDGTTSEIRHCPSRDRIPLNAVLQLLLLRNHIIQLLEDVRCPILIIHSKKDRIVPLEDSFRLYRCVGSRKKKLMILERGGHNLFKDFNRQKVIDLIIRWMEKEK